MDDFLLMVLLLVAVESYEISKFIDFVFSVLHMSVLLVLLLSQSLSIFSQNIEDLLTDLSVFNCFVRDI